jgi:hypothetical protein
MERAGSVNWYLCDNFRECGNYIMVVLRDDGTTPMKMACRAQGEPGPANSCPGTMSSMFYPRPPWPDKDSMGTPIPKEPDWEFCKPDEEGIHALQREGKWTTELAVHVTAGGLVIRPITRTGQALAAQSVEDHLAWLNSKEGREARVDSRR